MKKRLIYLIITEVVMIMGLLSRKYMYIFPKSIAPFVGDMLWAMMVYFGFRFLNPKLKIIKTLILAIIFSFSIEISQLYQADWINNIRSTTIGGLILGHGFLFEDLISYLIGIILGAIINKLVKV
ncbi:glycopeptide antibiotics resistance protein [Paeniclostridium ghonii]|uniref:Glycopeptide antibiotics resistance protein n=2 Tax=Paraclostridium ghonii TaxID=29358 RepID=A0ABU0MX85_9FIRM|nr:glycopeptide antibiotics resistance protein [Paeniclostridium ghonii]